MSKTKTAKTKSAKAVKPAPQVKKDAKGRFWLVPKDGGAEQGPFGTKKEALNVKAEDATGAPVAAENAPAPNKTAKSKKTKQPTRPESVLSKNRLGLTKRRLCLAGRFGKERLL
jgi:hypothetical protein